jgi:Regulator of ribonuclease activity B
MGRTDEELLAKRDELMSRDIDQIAAVMKYGIDLDKKRVIDLTFWAPNESTAKTFVEACERNEMSPHTILEPGPSETNQRWLVRCAINASVNFVTTKENLVTFLLFADKYDCEYDGWGTAIVEAASS